MALGIPRDLLTNDIDSSARAEKSVDFHYDSTIGSMDSFPFSSVFGGTSYFLHLLSAAIFSHETSSKFDFKCYLVFARCTCLHTLSMSMGRPSGGNRVLPTGCSLFCFWNSSKMLGEWTCFHNLGKWGYCCAPIERCGTAQYIGQKRETEQSPNEIIT